ncbi:MAG TPA: hypothetical protein VGM20_04335 [Gemmatimonadales bacterium]|jgi:hypothetical protein
MASGLTINGTDVSTYKAAVSAKPQWLDLPAITVDEQALGSGLGTVLGFPSTGSRSLGFSLLVRGDSPTDLLSQVDALSAFYRRTITIVQSIRSDRQISGLVTQVVEKKTGARDLMTKVELTFTLKCPDPRWRQVSATPQTGISTTPVAIMLGTAPVEDWQGVFHGASTDQFVTVKNGAGATIATFGWVGSLLLADTLTVDASEWMTRKGVSLSPMATWYGEYPIFKPEDAPTVQTNSGTFDLSFNRADWE